MCAIPSVPSNRLAIPSSQDELSGRGSLRGISGRVPPRRPGANTTHAAVTVPDLGGSP